MGAGKKNLLAIDAYTVSTVLGSNAREKIYWLICFYSLAFSAKAFSLEMDISNTEKFTESSYLGLDWNCRLL